MEDCTSNLLDVDDIDRKITAARARERAGHPDPNSLSSGMMAEDNRGLMQRRGQLLSGIISPFRLPTTPLLSQSSSPSDPYQSSHQSDGVFQRVMMLSKGRKLLSRVLLTLNSPLQGSSNNPQAIHLIWAALRASHLFFGASPSGSATNPATSFLFYLTGSSPVGGSDAASALADSSSRVAQALIEAMQSIVSSPGDITSCLESLTYGLSLSTVSKKGAPPPHPTASILPLIRTNKAVASGSLSQSRHEWLSDVIVKLITRGQEVLSAGLVDSSVIQRWSAAAQRMAELLTAHLGGVAFLLKSPSQVT